MQKTSTKKQLKNKFYATAVLLTLFFSQSKAQLIYGTVSNSVLVTFSATTPGSITSSITITGITPGQTIEGLDFRPNTGQLYALGYNKTLALYQVYTINVTTGSASAINTPTNIALGNGPIGFDFNPTVDRIRVISANGGNYRLHPTTGLIAATDGTLAYASGDPNVGFTPKIVAGAYINSYIGAGTTALYDYDNALNILALQNPPNNGSLTTIGVSGIITNTLTPLVDLDIFYDNSTSTNKVYLVSTTSASASVSNLYTLNVTTGATSLIGAIGSTNPVSNIAIFIDRTLPTLTGELAYGLSGSNLISFDTQNPNFIRDLNPITGVTAGQTIVGMDFRPATNTLYALGYNSSNNDAQLYTINTTSAVATVITSTPIALNLGTVSVGFDFNPTVDRIRVVSNNDNNYRLEPLTGTIAATDANINYATGDLNFGVNPNAGNLAYTNSFGGSTVTTLYNYDEALNILVTQNPANSGSLTTIGGSGISINPADLTVDLDIFYNNTSGTNFAYLAANTGTETSDRLYSINLTTGATSPIGKIGFGVAVRDIAIQTSSIVTGITQPIKNSEINFTNVYPNPLSENTFITIKNGNTKITVYDILGKEVSILSTTETIGNTTFIKWDTNNLVNGLYFVTATTNNGIKQTIKVIK